MSKLAIGLCALLLTAGVGGAKESDDQAKIGKILQDIVDAAQHKDLARLDAFHAYGPKFSKFEDDGLGRQDAAAGKILAYDVDTGKEKMAGKDRSTLVFVKQGGAWKIVHEHHSPLSPPK